MSESTSLTASFKVVFYKILKKIAAVPDLMPPMRYHVSNTVINYQDSYISSVIEFEGDVFESIPDEILESNFDALTKTWSEVGQEFAGRLMLNAYQLRRKIETKTEYQFENRFCQEFSDKYQKRFNDKDYFENRFYIVVTLKYTESIDEAIEELTYITDNICKKTAYLDPKLLSAYKNDNGVLASEIFEFFYDLVNNEKNLGSFPLTGTPAFDAIPSSSLHFGYEIMQSRGLVRNVYATFLDLKDFPSEIKLGMFNQATLSLPFEYNLVHSFVAIQPAKALHRINDQLNRLRSTEDKAEHQQVDLVKAQGYIQSGELCFGDYHSGMIIYGKTAKEAIENRATAAASLSNYAGTIYRAAQLSAPATFFAQFPLYKNTPRKMIKSSRNFAGVFSMHNYSRGKAFGNPLGDGSAIMPLETRAKGLYNFNFHFTNPLEDAVGEAIAGHTLILGATGTGKTTLQSALIAYLQRFNPAMFILDKDRGMDIFIRVLDGDYFNFKKGEATGINPFQFADSPQLREFLNNLIVALATDNNITCTSEEQNQIKAAIDGIMSLPPASRRLAAILHILPDTGGNCLYQRLLKWCVDPEGNVGRFSWVLDNPVNTFNPDDFRIVGFDVGAFLEENYQPAEPMLACLLYLKDQMAKKHSTLLTLVEECWLPLKYKIPQMMIEDVLKTGRKRGEFIILTTQSPEETVKSPIFPTIIQQTSTKILLPNPAAEYRNEQGGGYSRVSITEKEFNKLKELDDKSRAFLIKQGLQSCFASLDLYGFKDEIAVLSGTTGNVEILDAIIDRYQAKDGIKPKSSEWLDVFYQAVRIKKSATSMSQLVNDAFAGVGKVEYINL